MTTWPRPHSRVDHGGYHGDEGTNTTTPDDRNGRDVVSGRVGDDGGDGDGGDGDGGGGGGGEKPPPSSAPMGITDIHVHIHPTLL